MTADACDAERRRLFEDGARWRRWGTYLPYREWGTLRENADPDRGMWDGFSRDDAAHRPYRWAEDGIFGYCDDRCRLILAPVFWNGVDRRLKERFFGLTNNEAPHGEDVKELYDHVAATPTGSYAVARYRYPQRPYPESLLLEAAAERDIYDPDVDLVDTGVLDEGDWFDITTTYAKATPEDVILRIEVRNRGSEPASCHVLPQLWLRNTWSWSDQEGGERPGICTEPECIRAEHPELGGWCLHLLDGPPLRQLVTDNIDDADAEATGGYGRSAFHQAVVHADPDAVNPDGCGTKAAAWYRLDLEPGARAAITVRLCPDRDNHWTLAHADRLIAQRREECEAFYRPLVEDLPDQQLAQVVRGAYAGLCWNRQYYGFGVANWLRGNGLGDPERAWQARRHHPNAAWQHLRNHDVLIVPDKWEFPWYAAWDLAFHAVAYAAIDVDEARHMVETFLGPRYQHPAGGLPSFENDFGAPNPPLQAWAVRRIVRRLRYDRGYRAALSMIESCWGGLLLQLGWWLNRRDRNENNVFSGGFMGLDNIGPFGRPRVLPDGRLIEQADSSAWVAAMAAETISLGLELGRVHCIDDPVLASLVQQFLLIAERINQPTGQGGLWDEEDGFYYDRICDPEHDDCPDQVLRLRSLAGLIPLVAVCHFDLESVSPDGSVQRMVEEVLEANPSWERFVVWQQDRSDRRIRGLRLVPAERLRRLLDHLGDSREFCSPFGVRSLSAWHADHPVRVVAEDEEDEVRYEPGWAVGSSMGANSNWRGPVWIHMNYLLVDALHSHARLIAGGCPGPGRQFGHACGSHLEQSLRDTAEGIRGRLIRLFRGDAVSPHSHPARADLTLFHEYYHAESGAGLGASHLTGWTALIAELICHPEPEPERLPG